MLPYNDPRCRASLYKVLENLVLCPSPQWPAPIHYASVIFKNGLNDSNLDVRLGKEIEPKNYCFIFLFKFESVVSIKLEAKLKRVSKISFMKF